MTKQLTLTEALAFGNSTRKRSKTHYKLQHFHKIIDWNSLESLIGSIDKTKQGKGGCPPMALSIKIKMFFLQHIYNMSNKKAI